MIMYNSKDYCVMGSFPFTCNQPYSADRISGHRKYGQVGLKKIPNLTQCNSFHIWYGIEFDFKWNPDTKYIIIKLLMDFA